MGRKMFFALVFFGAGFATALYLVAPASESQTGQEQAAWTDQTMDRQQFRQELLDVSCKIRLGMNKLVGFAEEQSVRLAEYVQEKWAEHQAKNG
jgi:hypothetical protein